MDALFLIGRILYGGYFIMNGFHHLFKRQGLINYAQSKGVPQPKNAVMVSGILISLGGLGILLGVLIRWSIIFIAIFLVVVSFKMHDFWKMSDPQAKAMEKIQFTKNMALLGADLMFWMISLPWPLALF